MTPTLAEPVLKGLERIWGPAPGFVGWLSAVNHKAVGRRYIVTAGIFFLAAGIQALVMRAQLAQPGMELLTPEQYNQFFTMHGATMMFLFAVPMMEGIGIYLIPLMIGARDMVFPRLNAFGYWVYLIAGTTLYVGFFFGAAPDAGWFNYPPFSSRAFSPGIGIDYWVTAITFIEVAALVAAVEILVTILKARAAGMSMGRAPLFVWSQLIMAIMIIFAMPPLILASVMLGLDRMMGAHFFNVAAGGDPVLWQHLFWIFGHPEVYIILIPALGIVSAVVTIFSRRAMVGYSLDDHQAHDPPPFRGVGVRDMKRGNAKTSLITLPIAMLMLVVFLGLKIYEYAGNDWGISTHAYGSIVMLITGLHMAHVGAVILKSGVILQYIRTGRIEPRRAVPLQANAVYYYFVAGIWVPLYATIYLAPHLLS